ncbi:hypothetical protein BDN70DRAFT_994940 [Pholiota conissans]|uniref:Uncharacterized protein n=1 Tax=Pholiota conissans TaxID=109636 RepID=A0A9P5YX91_9AGAR|nr:hypothetical protein BDN70DRAFT_994940 [Pholiota conissans]
MNPLSHLPNTAEVDAYNQSPAAVDALGWNEPMPGVYTSDPPTPVRGPIPQHRLPAHKDDAACEHSSSQGSEYSPNTIQNILLPASEVETEETEIYRSTGRPTPSVHRDADNCMHYPSCVNNANCIHRHSNPQQASSASTQPTAAPSTFPNQTALPRISQAGQERTMETTEYASSSLQNPQYDTTERKPKVEEEHHQDTKTKVNAKPNLGDRIIGKTEEVAGKITRNITLQEKGEARRIHGKN